MNAGFRVKVDFAARRLAEVAHHAIAAMATTECSPNAATFFRRTGYSASNESAPEPDPAGGLTSAERCRVSWPKL